MKISHLNGLRALEATLRNKTFTAAAAELGVTVAAVGQQIRGLEDFVGGRLFDRLPSGARPTELALAIGPRLSLGFSQLDEALRELQLEGREHSLMLTMSQSILDEFLSPRMARFHARFPDLKVEYSTGEEFVDLIKGEVHMAIRFSAEPGPDYSFEELYKGCSVPICTPDFAERHGLTPGSVDLTGVPLFQLHDRTADPEWIDWPSLLARHHIKKLDRNPVQQVSGYGVALSGEGLLLCGLTEAINDLAAGRTIAPLGPKFVTHLSFGYRLVWPAGRSMSKPMKDFRTWVLHERDEFISRASSILSVDLI